MQRLNVEYGLDIRHLTFFPIGEDSTGYVAETAAQARRFVKVYDERRPPNLETVLRATHILRTQCGLDYVVSALPARGGRFDCEYGAYRVAAFPFIDGTTPFQERFSDEEHLRLAAVLASLHNSGECLIRSSMEVAIETFDPPFTKIVRHVLAVAAEDRPANDRQRETGRLLMQWRDDIEATLDHFERLGAQGRAMRFQQVLTHGDPTPANIIKDARGDLHLIDWGDLALGPAERDVTHFTGERFEPFLAEYKRALGQPIHLHGEIFEFYFYRWVLQEIADYGSRILLKNVEGEELEHAWEELVQYVPIRRDGIRASVRNVRSIIQRVFSE